jgi:pantothenate kinase type III
MMANALLAGTGRVRFSQLEWSDVRLGNTTAKAVSNGLLAAVVALIERLSTEKTQKIILTGGDAEKIIPHLSMAFQYEPELLLYGLQRYFEYAGINTPLALMPNIEE